MRPEPPSKPANAASSGNTSRSPLPAEKHTATSFRDAIKRREPPHERLHGKHDPPAGASVRNDGLLVINATALPPGVAIADRAPRAPSKAESPARAERSPRSVALTDVKIGGTKDSVQVHARLGEGRHTGVELRAIERDGKVSIELVARDAMAERALRVELSEMREALRVRGLEGVSVDVRSDDDAPRHREPEANELAGSGDASRTSEHREITPTADEDAIVL